MDSTRPHRKILRMPSLKRRSKGLPVNQRVQLERVLGVTVSSNTGLSCDSNSGTIAYLAGCVVVLFNHRRNKQEHILNAAKKTITCLAISQDGKYITTGETGHQPAVRVWDVQEKTQVAEFCGHKFGISCVAFSPNMREVVSVGTQHDMMINVWSWKTGNKVASNKVSSKVSALAYSDDGKCFVTVGNRHVRFWYLEDRRSKINETVPLMGRSGILGTHKDNLFCDVAAGKGTMSGRFFVITQSGLLCQFSEKRQLDKWVELRTNSAKCITAGKDLIFVGCCEGVVRVFSATSLHFLCSLPRPHPLGVEVTAAINPSHLLNSGEDAKYPDTMAIAADDGHKKVTCIYNDRSIYIWDVHDIKRMGKAWSSLYHSGCIWALEMYPVLEDETKANLPPGSFLTASVDDTIRVWNLNAQMPENTVLKRNIYSNELLKIIYVDPALASLCNVDYNPAGATDKTDTMYDGKNGVRSIRVSSDGTDLASGDRQGNIRIYDMYSMSEKKHIEAHDSDVMCLEYSYSSSGCFLASSSRDRLIHVFDVEEDYGLVQTLDDHSSSITAVRFTDLNNKLQMISCGADKSILLRSAVTNPDFHFELEHHLATKISMYDMVVDPKQKFLATACQDRNVRLYNIQTTKEHKCYRGSVGDEGVLLRIHLDPSGSYAATTCTDKSVCILDFQTGELMATMYGHSDVITSVKFDNDFQHVITVSADGCIFVWLLPEEMTNQIKGKLHEFGKSVKEAPILHMPDGACSPSIEMLPKLETDGKRDDLQPASVYNVPVVDGRCLDAETSCASLDFSCDQLPSWAKTKIGIADSESFESRQEQIQPRGQWAKRVQSSMELKSQFDLPSLGDTYTAKHETEISSTLQESQQKSSVPENWDNNFHGSEASGNLNQAESISAFPAKESCMPGLKLGLTKNNSVEVDDTDPDIDETIYPPVDSDCEPLSGTYQVFAVSDVTQNISRGGQGSMSAQDEVNGDQVSLDDEDLHSCDSLNISGPPTPSEPDKEFPYHTPDKEDFVRENFEVEDSLPPALFQDDDDLDANIVTAADMMKVEPSHFGRRLSLSARFKSHVHSPNFCNSNSSIVQSSQTPCRPDVWLVKNAVEVDTTEGDSHRNLLAAFHNCADPETESLSDLSPTEAESSTQRKSEDTFSCCSKDSSKASRESASPDIYNSNSVKVFEELEIRNHLESLEEFQSSPSSSNITRAEIRDYTYSQLSENKAKRKADGLSILSYHVSQHEDLTSKNVRVEGGMLRAKSMMYASSPDLVSNLGSKYKESTASPGFQSLSALSSSLPDIISVNQEKMGCSEESYSSQHPYSSTVNHSCGVMNKHQTPPTQSALVYSSYLLSSGAGHSAPSSIQSKEELTADFQHSPNCKKADVSGQSSDQTTGFLFGTRDNRTLTGIALDCVSSTERASEKFLSEIQFPVSTVQGDTACSSDSDPSQNEAVQLIVSNESRQSVGSHHKKITSYSFHKPIHSLQTNLEASPQDLPEKDPSSKRSVSPQQPPHSASLRRSFSPQQQPHPASLRHSISPQQQPPHPVSLRGSISPQPHPASLRHSISPQQPPHPTSLRHSISPQQQQPHPASLRHSISPPQQQQPHTASLLPQLHQQHNHCFSRSKSSKPPEAFTDSTYSDLEKDNSNSGKCNTESLASVRNSIALYESSQNVSLLHFSSSASMSVNQCKSVLNDFRSQLQLLRELYMQVDGRSDETAEQIIMMLGDVFHEAQVLIADMAPKVPGPTTKDSSSFLLDSLLSPPSTAGNKTFHVSAQKRVSGESCERGGLGEQAAQLSQNTLLAATMDMLQPLVSRLTRDLCEGVCKMVGERSADKKS